jgi:aerobic carbon-monoxide dehydrogenase medium subunit
MTLPRFDYVVPRNIEETLDLLAKDSENRKLIAGGQSLVPLLSFRLVHCNLIIDLQKLTDLRYIKIDDEEICIGALTRWVDLEKCSSLKDAHPLLYSGCLEIAHFQIRNRGTVGGSLAHADPAAELPCIAATCEARISVRSKRGRREILASEFFLGPLETSLMSDEIITEISFEKFPSDRRWAFEEFARRPGDLAITGVSLCFDLGETGMPYNSRIAVFGTAGQALRIQAAEHELDSSELCDQRFKEIGAVTASSVDLGSDVHGTADYRRALVQVLTERALRAARDRRRGDEHSVDRQ